MRYRSTRGGVEDCGFIDAVLMGLAPDRGLLVPKTIPKVDAAPLKKWSTLPFAQLATEVISLYIDEAEISRAELDQLTKTAYANWRSTQVTPVHHLEGDFHLLELFHGPTYAFKDVALQSAPRPGTRGVPRLRGSAARRASSALSSTPRTARVRSRRPRCARTTMKMCTLLL